MGKILKQYYLWALSQVLCLAPVLTSHSIRRKLVGESIDCLKKLACSARSFRRIIQQEVVIEYTLESCGSFTTIVTSVFSRLDPGATSKLHEPPFIHDKV